MDAERNRTVEKQTATGVRGQARPLNKEHRMGSTGHGTRGGISYRGKTNGDGRALSDVAEHLPLAQALQLRGRHLMRPKVGLRLPEGVSDIEDIRRQRRQLVTCC